MRIGVELFFFRVDIVVPFFVCLSMFHMVKSHAVKFCNMVIVK